MKLKTRCRVLAMIISLSAILPGCAGYSAANQVNALDKTASLNVSGPQVVTTAQMGNVVMEWNEQAASRTLSASPALQPIQQTRLMAIVQLAMHDAVNGITGQYATYLTPGAAPANASPDAAAIAAAYYALKNLPVNQSPSLETDFAVSLAAHGVSEFDPGVEYGRAAAAAVLAVRANDHSAQAQFPYTAPGAGTPGVWVPISAAPNAQALLPGWGNVTPFALRSGSQFRPEPPPALDSEKYAQDYNEIKIIGATGSPTRTSEQTQIAQFWLASPTAIWNPVLRQVIATRDLDLSAQARAFALLYVAAADAGIGCWEAKYVYNFWRPQLAIRGGDTDGNNLTVGDATWLPALLPTPRHPEYPSGHSANSGAMAEVLELLFGDDPGMTLVVTVSGITRQWQTFDQGVEEVIDARIYSGFHFRTSDEAGARMGRQIARFAWTHTLRQCPKGKPHCG